MTERTERFVPRESCRTAEGHEGMRKEGSA
jgi:hypothetical protein